MTVSPMKVDPSELPFTEWVRYWLKCLFNEHIKSTEWRDIQRDEGLNNGGICQNKCKRCGLWHIPKD